MNQEAPGIPATISIKEALSKSQYIGLFFAAPWSGPCHAWASVLNSFKLEMNSDQSDFLEVVLIPSSIIRNEIIDQDLISIE